MVDVAIAGFGWWGQHMVRRLDANSKINVRLVIDPAEERLAQVHELGLPSVADFDAALADPSIEAIILTTPNTMHESQVVAAAAAGKHVFCEKPLGLTGESARNSVAACQAAGVMLGIGHERRFEPALQRVRDLVRDGALGTVMHAEAAFSHDKLASVPAGDWRTSKSVSPAAGMTAMGIHLSDFYISLFGRVKTVQALTADRILGWETPIRIRPAAWPNLCLRAPASRIRWSDMNGPIRWWRTWKLLPLPSTARRNILTHMTRWCIISKCLKLLPCLPNAVRQFIWQRRDGLSRGWKPILLHFRGADTEGETEPQSP